MEDNQDSDNQESRFERIKRHIKENKTTYLVGGVCLGAGYFLRQPKVIAPVFNNTPVIAPVMNNIGNQQINSFGGPMTKMVKCLETGEIWETVTDAAEDAGTSIAYMSRHLNGHKDHLYNKHYKIIGLGTID